MGPRRWGARLLAAGVTAIGLAVGCAVTPRAVTAQAAAVHEGAAAVVGLRTADQAEVSSQTTYVVDPAQSAVHVIVRLTVTPSASGTGSSTAAPLDVPVPVPPTATGLRATSGGSPVAVATTPTADSSSATALVTVAASGGGGEPAGAEVSYDLVGAAPRSADSTRVGAEHASFAVSAPGSAGPASVEVVVPTGWTTAVTSSAFTESTTQGRHTLRATAGADSGGIAALVSVRSPKAATTPLTVGRAAFVLESWPGDTAWTAFVSDALRRGLPVLERTVGLSWPTDGPTTIRESSGPGAWGVDGWGAPQGQTVTVSEGLDPAVLYHQLAHVWASAGNAPSSWVREGIAEYLARRTTEELGTAAGPAPTVSRDAPDAVPLSSWTGPTPGPGTATDAYAAATSRQVVEQLCAGLDPDSVAEVLRAAMLGESAYDPPSVRTQLSAAGTDWRRFLDLVEVRGGQATASQVYAEWVLSPQEQPLLTERTAARNQYLALDAADGTWLPPLAVRAAMTRWAFGDAEAAMSLTQPALPDVMAVQQTAVTAGIVVPDGVQTLYENAASTQDLADLPQRLVDSTTAIRELGGAIAVWNSDNPAARLGATVLFVRSGIALAATDLDEGHIEQGGRAAAHVAARARWAVPVGVVLLAVLAAVGVAVGVIGWRIARRRRGERRERTGGDGAATGGDSVSSESGDNVSSAGGDSGPARADGVATGVDSAATGGDSGPLAGALSEDVSGARHTWLP